MIAPTPGTGCLKAPQAHTACKAEWLSSWPVAPALLRGRLLGSGSSPLATTSLLTREESQAGVDLSGGGKVLINMLPGEAGLLVHGPHLRSRRDFGLSSTPLSSGATEPALGVSCAQNPETPPPERSPGPAHGQPCLPLVSLPGGCPAGRGRLPSSLSQHFPHRGSFHPGVSSWGSWGGLMESRGLSLTLPGPCPLHRPLLSLLGSSAPAVPLELSSEERKWLLFAYFGFDFTLYFCSPPPPFASLFQKRSSVASAPGFPFLGYPGASQDCSATFMTPLCLSGRGGRSAPGAAPSPPARSEAPGRRFAASCLAPSS